VDRSSDNVRRLRPLEGGAAHRRSLEEELRASIRQREALVRLGISTLSETSLPELMDESVRTVTEVLEVEYCELLELMPDGTELFLRAGVGWKAGYVGRATVGANLESQAGYTLISRGPVVVDDLQTENRFNGPPLLLEHGAVSGISTIIHVSGHIYGVLGAHTKQKRQFAGEEVDFLRDVADLLGLAIEKRQTEEATQAVIGERAWATRQRFVFLAEANTVLSTSMDYATTLATAARLAVPAIADWCFVDIVEPDGGIHRIVVAHARLGSRDLARELHSSYPLNPNASHGTPKVLRTGGSELIKKVDQTVLESIARDAEHVELLRHLDPESYICVPLQVRGQLLGTVGLLTAESKRSYGPDDVILAEGLARCAALALDNARQQETSIEMVRDLVHKVAQSQRTTIAPEPQEASVLTPRQLEVLRLLSGGRSAKEIANALSVSHETARNHIRAVLKILGAHSQLEAVSRARELGILA
jgi:GAF domain-containing protein